MIYVDDAKIWYSMFGNAISRKRAAKRLMNNGEVREK